MQIITKIYRCWIVWGCNIYVVILPSILAIAFLGQFDSVNLRLSFLTGLFNLLSLAFWLACANASQILPNGILQAPWGTWLGVAGIVMSMIVNAYATGLIAFRIFKMYRHVNPSLGNHSEIKYRRVLSIIIESGIALFSIQLIRVVLVVNFEMTGSDVPLNALEIVIAIHEILNVSTIITSVIDTSR